MWYLFSYLKEIMIIRMIYITLLNPFYLFVSRCNVHFSYKIVIPRDGIYIYYKPNIMWRNPVQFSMWQEQTNGSDRWILYDSIASIFSLLSWHVCRAYTRLLMRWRERKKRRRGGGREEERDGRLKVRRLRRSTESCESSGNL